VVGFVESKEESLREKGRFIYTSEREMWGSGTSTSTFMHITTQVHLRLLRVSEALMTVWNLTFTHSQLPYPTPRDNVWLCAELCRRALFGASSNRIRHNFEAHSALRLDPL
jgi:hypothetical protein